MLLPVLDYAPRHNRLYHKHVITWNVLQNKVILLFNSFLAIHEISRLEPMELLMFIGFQFNNSHTNIFGWSAPQGIHPTLPSS
jgi:hypothetical protein